ncbi:MAG: hypothetical protein ABFS21_08285 [Actinomycetota bacterium]
MSDLGSLLREHYEEIAPPINVEGLADRLLTEERLHPTPSKSKGVLVAVAAALIVLLVIGGTTMLIMLNQGEVVDEPVPTTVPSTTLPDETAPDVIDPGPDESALPTVADVGLPFTVLDSEGDVGAGASVIVGTDGIPLVAYTYHPVHSDEPSEIRIATCADAACSAAGSVRTIADVARPAEEGGWPLAVEIRALLPTDGLPIVIWSEWEDAEGGGQSYLRSYKCTDAVCTDGTLVDVHRLDGNELWVGAGSDNTPVVAQGLGEWMNKSLRITKCDDPACAEPAESSVVDLAGVGWGIAVTFDSEGDPVIAAALTDEEGAAPTLGVARCGDALCSEAPQFVDTGVTVRELSAVALDSDNRPIILVESLTAGPEAFDQFNDLALVACTDAACSEQPVLTPMTTSTTADGGDIDPFGSLVVADEGAVTVLHTSGGAIRALTCDDPTCEGGVVDVAAIPQVGMSETVLTLDTAGNPVVAIHSNTDLGVFVCSEPTCAADQVLSFSDMPAPKWATTIAAPGDVSFNGMNPSIEIGPDGYPVIGYAGLSTNRGPEGERVTVPKLMICGDAGCVASTTKELTEDAWWVSMTVLPDGRPVAAYSTWSEESETDELFIVWCSDPVCSTWTTEKIAESGWTNSTVPLVSHPDGSVTVVYQNGDDYYVYLVTCSEGACEGAESVKIDSLVDPNDKEWGLRYWMNTLDVAMLPDGRPVIAAAQDNGELRYVECLDTACAESQRVLIDRTYDANGTVEVGPSGLPILAHYDDGELTVTACHDTGCSDMTTTATGEATATFIAQVTASIAFGSDGNPMIAYWAPRALMLAECHDPMCTESTVDVFAAVRTYDLAVLPNGSPVLTYFAHSAEDPPLGEEEFGALVDLRVAECTSGTCVGD